MSRKRRPRPGPSDKPADLLRPLSQERSGERIVAMRMSSELHFSGPLPPPQILERYDQIVPGMAERLVVLVEKQQHHRHEQERKLVDCQIDLSRHGQRFAFGVALAGLGSAVVLGLCGQQIAASVIGGSTLCGLVYTFISGRSHQEQQQAKRDALAKSKPEK